MALDTLRLPEGATIIPLLKPAADAAGRTSRYISLKNLHKAYIVAFVDQANAATIALTPLQASAVAGTGSKAIPATQVWAQEDIAASGNVFTRQTDAASFTTSAAVGEKVVVFAIEPAALDVANGFDCVAVSTGASNVANITSAFIVGAPRHSPAPNALVD